MILLNTRKLDKAAWKTEFELPWRDHLDDKVDSDQWVVNKERSFLLNKPARVLR